MKFQRGNINSRQQRIRNPKQNGLRPSQYTPFKGFLFTFLFTNSMNYNVSLSNESDSCLYNRTGDIIHAFTHDGREIRTRTDAATSPSIAMYFVLTYSAAETFKKKKKKKKRKLK